MPETPRHLPRIAFAPEKLQALRQDAGMSIVRLGVRLWEVGGTATPATRQQIDNWEAGRCRPNSATLRGLAEIFGVTMESFFRKVDESCE